MKQAERKEVQANPASTLVKGAVPGAAQKGSGGLCYIGASNGTGRLESGVETTLQDRPLPDMTARRFDHE